MRTALTVLGVLLMLAGAVWFLQSMQLLPGHYMSGKREWTINGGITFVVGVVLLVVARRRRALP